MIRPGLCSVTFRELGIDRVAGLAADAGLMCIEWAGDAHVPAGDIDAAESARERTEAAGLAVASYGSYLAFDGGEEEFGSESRSTIASARALGAPRIRVWAGTSGSADTTPEDRARIVTRLQDTADGAAEHGIDLGLEFHGGTLTDEVASTRRLLDEVGRDNVRTYWQPHQDMPVSAALGTLHRVLPWTSTVHVFSWWPNHQRHLLSERADLWREVFTVLAVDGSDRDALLEFVPGDDPALLPREAESLRRFIAES